MGRELAPQGLRQGRTEEELGAAGPSFVQLLTLRRDQAGIPAPTFSCLRPGRGAKPSCLHSSRGSRVETMGSLPQPPSPATPDAKAGRLLFKKSRRSRWVSSLRAEKKHWRTHCKWDGLVVAFKDQRGALGPLGDFKKWLRSNSLLLPTSPLPTQWDPHD